MKKVTAAVLTFAFLFVSTGVSYSSGANTVSRSQTATGLLKDVRYSSDGKNESVDISAVKYEDFSVIELASPKRIVIDIFNAQASGKQQYINTDGRVIKRIRYAQFDQYTARVVLEVNSDTEYGIKKTDKGLLLFIGEEPGQHEQGKAGGTGPGVLSTETAGQAIDAAIPATGTTGQALDTSMTAPGTTGQAIDTTIPASGTNVSAPVTTGQSLSVSPLNYDHISYQNTGDRVSLILDDAILTIGDSDLQELYTGSYDETGLKYTVTFPTGQADLGSGVMNIKDRYLRSIEVRTNPEDGTTSLIFNGAGRYTYLPFTRSSLGNTAITILKPAEKKQKLVVIDPGHGGSMVGAIYRDLYEKDLNLDIAKRLNALLVKKGVKTYMIRSDDTDVDNFERAHIANKLGAKLYLSIHNNAIDNKSFRGTMTLYCPTDMGSGFSGWDFARIIQGKLLAKLKTTDRSVRERSDLIVLRETNMPASLAEIAYMTNSTDRSNLQKTTFRQNAAQALCDSIIKALTKIN